MKVLNSAGVMSTVTNVERVTYDFDSSDNPSSVKFKRTEMNRTGKNSKLPTFCRFCPAQLFSEVSGTRGTLPFAACSQG